MQMKKISTFSYYYYLLWAQQDIANQERITIKQPGTSINDPKAELCLATSQTQVYPSENEYHILLKQGNEADAIQDCPTTFYGQYNYSVTDTSGPVTCDSGTGDWDVCTDYQRMTFNYTSCNTKIASSANGSVACVFSMTSGSNTLVTVYNEDASVVAGYERFTCFISSISSDGSLELSQSPGSCPKDQIPTSVPSLANGTGVGLQMSLTPKVLCPILPETSTNAGVSTSVSENPIQSGLSNGAIAGIILALAALGAFIIFLICFYMKFRSKKSEKEKSRNENNSSANARSIICCQWKNKRMDAEKTESPIRSARQANSKSMDIDLMNHVRHPLWIHSHGSTPPTGTESPVVQPLEDGTPTPLPFFHRKETPTITKSVKEKSAENSENQSRVSLPITLVKENSITYFKSKEGKTQTSAVRDIVVPSKPVVLTDLEQDTAEKKINDHFEPEAQLVISPAQSNYSKSYTVSPSVDLEIETESPNTTPKPTLRLPVSPKPRANIANKNADYALDKEVSKLTSQKEIASRNQDRSSRTNISRVNTMTPVSISGKENVTKLASPPVLIHCLEDTHTQISRVNSISPVPISDKEKTSTFVSDVDKMNHYVSEQNKHHMNPDMLKIGKDKPSASSNHRSENALPDNPRIVSTFFSKEEMTYASKFFDVKKLEKDQPKQKKRRQKIKKTKPAVSATSGKELKSIKKSNSCKASSVNENGKNHAFQNIARCKTFTSQHNKLGEFYNDDIPILKPNQKAKKIDIEETLVGIAYDDDNVKSRNRRTKPTDKEEIKISTSKSVTFRPMSSENTSSSNEVKQSASNYPEKNTQTSTTSQNTIDSNFPLSVGSRSALREGTRFFMENETSVVKLNVSDEDSYSDGNDTYEELSESEISEGLTEDDEESENDTDSHTIKQMRSNPPSEYISTAMSVVYGDESGRESDPDRMLIANYDPYLDEDTD